jgi:hypothetical protein
VAFVVGCQKARIPSLGLGRHLVLVWLGCQYWRRHLGSDAFLFAAIWNLAMSEKSRTRPITLEEYDGLLKAIVSAVVRLTHRIEVLEGGLGRLDMYDAVPLEDVDMKSVVLSREPS